MTTPTPQTAKTRTAANDQAHNPARNPIHGLVPESGRSASAGAVGSAQGASWWRRAGRTLWTVPALGLLALTAACGGIAAPYELADDLNEVPPTVPVSSTATSQGTAPTDTTSGIPVGGAQPLVDGDSYQLTSGSMTIGHIAGKSTKSTTAACADGYYVRPGPAPALTPAVGIQPSVQLHGDDKWISASSTRPQDRYGPGNAWSPFKTFGITLHNESFDHDHTVTFSWWCDAVTPAIQQQTAAKKSEKLGVQPIPPSCDYCGWPVTALTDATSDRAINNSGGTVTTGNPVISWPSQTSDSNQHWNYREGGFLDDLPTYSIWLGNQGLTKALLVEDQTSHLISLRTSAGSVPVGGNWYYVDQVSGPDTNHGLLLVNTDSNRCLTAGPDQGDQLRTMPCNTLDNSQWWGETR